MGTSQNWSPKEGLYQMWQLQLGYHYPKEVTSRDHHKGILFQGSSKGNWQVFVGSGLGLGKTVLCIPCGAVVKAWVAKSYHSVLNISHSLQILKSPSNLHKTSKNFKDMVLQDHPHPNPFRNIGYRHAHRRFLVSQLNLQKTSRKCQDMFNPLELDL